MVAHMMILRCVLASSMLWSECLHPPPFPFNSSAETLASKGDGIVGGEALRGF